MKVLLVYPPTNIALYNQERRLRRDPPQIPLGLAYIGGVLNQKRVDYRIYDMCDYDFKKVKSVLKKENPDLVGISCFTETRSSSFKVAKMAKTINPSTKIIMGGSHATLLAREVIAKPFVDIIAVGEAEYTLPEVIDCLEKGNSLKKVSGIVYKNEKKILHTKPRAIIDPGMLPMPAYESFDFNRYLRMGKKVTAPINTSRGCPCRCTYCSTSLFWGFRWRAMSSDKVLGQIEYLVNNFGAEAITFNEDTLTFDKNRMIKICKGLIERKIDLEWNGCTRVNCVSRELLSWMKKAGCVSISYGVETGSPAILKNINKNFTRQQAIDAFKMTNEAGINAGLLIMIGNQGETDATVDETISLIRAIRPYDVGINLTTIFPETSLYELAKKAKFIDSRYWNSDLASPINTMENDIKTLKKWKKKVEFNSFLYTQKRLIMLQKLIISHLLLPLENFVGIKVSTSEGLSFDGIRLNKLRYELEKRNIQEYINTSYYEP